MARTVTGVPAGTGGVLGEGGLPDFAADFYLADVGLAGGVVGSWLAGDWLARC